MDTENANALAGTPVPDPPAPKRTGLKVFSIVQLVLAWLLCWIPIFGQIASVLSVVLSIISVKMGAFRKKLVIILSAAALVVSILLMYSLFFSVSSSDVTDLITKLEDPSLDTSAHAATIEKTTASNKFERALAAELEEQEDLHALCVLLAHLDEAGYESEAAKEAFRDRVQAAFPAEGSEDFERRLLDYLDSVKVFSGDSYYYQETEAQEESVLAYARTLSERSLFDALGLARQLETCGYQNDALLRFYRELLPTEAFFAELDAKAFYAYLDEARDYAGMTVYASTVTLFPYREIAACFARLGEPLAGSGDGYYTAHRAEYQDESYWYDPLMKQKVGSGRVGTYQESYRYTFYGDFLRRSHSISWYDISDTDPDSPNSRAEGIYAAPRAGLEPLVTDPGAIARFISALGDGEAYYVSAGGDTFAFGVVEPDEIVIVLPDQIMFTLVYS